MTILKNRLLAIVAAMAVFFSSFDLLAAPSPGQGTIGSVTTGYTATICVTPTVTASNAYGINYVIGGLITFPNAFTNGGSGILQSVTVTINKVETIGFTFVPFNANPSATTWTNAAVAAINAADVDKVSEPIALTGSSVLGTHTIASGTQLAIPLTMGAGNTSLFGVLLSGAALTNQFTGSSDLRVCMKILQDP